MPHGLRFPALAGLAALLLAGCSDADDGRPPDALTRITLVASSPDGGPPATADVTRTAELFADRLTAAGFPESPVQTDGNQITLIVADQISATELQPLIAPGELYFRKVLDFLPADGTPGTPAPPADPAPAGTPPADLAAAREEAEAAADTLVERAADLATTNTPVPPELAEAVAPFGALTGAEVAELPVLHQFYVPSISCAQLASRPPPDQAALDRFVVACDGDGATRYLLDRAGLDSSHVAEATAAYESTAWAVTLEFTESGQGRWTGLTQQAADRAGDPLDPAAVTPAGDYRGQTPVACPAHRDAYCQVAAVRDHEVIIAPQILEATPGSASLTGDFTAGEARLLASQLQSGPLPLLLTIESVTPLTR